MAQNFYIDGQVTYWLCKGQVNISIWAKETPQDAKTKQWLTKTTNKTMPHAEDKAKKEKYV